MKTTATRSGEILYDLDMYIRLVRKLNYLTVTRPDIAFVVSAMSQFLSALRITNWDEVMQILEHLKKSPEKGFYIQIVNTSELLVFHMLIEPDYPLIGDLPHMLLCIP